MAKIREYELKTRMIAHEILAGSTPEATCSTYILDLTSIGEKRIVNKLIREYTETISVNNLFNFDNKHNEKVLQILNSRKEVLNRF